MSAMSLYEQANSAKNKLRLKKKKGILGLLNAKRKGRYIKNDEKPKFDSNREARIAKIKKIVEERRAMNTKGVTAEGLMNAAISERRNGRIGVFRRYRRALEKMATKL